MYFDEKKILCIYHNNEVYLQIIVYVKPLSPRSEIDFTLSNARRFYSSVRIVQAGSGVNGLTKYGH